MIHLEDHEYGSCITKRDQLNIITSVSSINIMQCVFMYIVCAFADLRKTTVRCQPGPTVLHINCRLTVNKQDMTSQKFPHTLPMMSNTCTEKLCTAATVHFP